MQNKYRVRAIPKLNTQVASKFKLCGLLYIFNTGGGIHHKFFVLVDGVFNSGKALGILLFKENYSINSFYWLNMKDYNGVK